MVLAEFRHIHCSSRFDRSAASLESDLDDWMAESSLITVTEIRRNQKAGQLREKGWAYYNHGSGGADDCGVAWRVDTWRKSYGTTKKLSNNRFYTLSGKPAPPVYSCSVLLKRVGTGHRLLVSVTHMPAHVEGPNHWRTTTDHWAARKAAYLSSLKNWSTHVKDLERKQRPDGTLIIADWNLNLKHAWVRNLLHDHFGSKYKQAWQRFPTSGGSLAGGPVAPLGAPGKGYGDRIIDGTLYRGLGVTTPPNLMARVKSSDHRPYQERFGFLAKAEHPGDDDAEGDLQSGDAWWGFGDYMDDEIYALNYNFDTGQRLS